jgi:hypothetical protein
MLKLFRSGEKADIAFKVGRKTIHAHSLTLILQANAPTLANLCDGQRHSLVINKIHPENFELIMEYIYLGQIPAKDLIVSRGRKLIDAANRYELIKLKIAIENTPVREPVNKRNVADYILFADAQSCPLLKEYAIAFLALHSTEVLKSEHSIRLRESNELLSEIIMQMGNENEEAITVTELRKELGKRKLDVDGSKDTLIARLEEAKRRKTA